MEIIPSVNFREYMELTQRGENLEGPISLTLEPNDIGLFSQMINEGAISPLQNIVSIENGSLDTYSLEHLRQRKSQLEGLFNYDFKFIELKHPFDTDLLERIQQPKNAILSFEDLEGIAKIDYNMILTLHRKYPELIFKIVATPENIVDVNQLIIWGKDMKSKGIKHVILCNGPFAELTPFLHSKFSNDLIIYRPPEISGQGKTSFLSSRIESICADLLHEMNPNIELQPVDQYRHSKKMLANQLDISSTKIAILGRSELANLERDFFSYLATPMDVKFSSVFVPLSSIEETSIFIQGIGKDLFDGFSFIGSDLTRVETVDVFDISTAKTGITTFLLNKGGELISFDTYHMLFEKILQPLLERDVVNFYIEGVNPVIFSMLPLFHSKANLIKIRNRNKEKIDIINQYFNKVEPIYPDEQHSFDVIINFVPFGTNGLPNMLPFSKRILSDATLVIDLTTSSKLTPLQQEAFSAGKTFYTGLDIIARKSLIEQRLVTRIENE